MLQRHFTRNRKDWVRGLQTTEQKQDACNYEAAWCKNKKVSKKLAAVPFNANPVFKLTRHQHDICGCIYVTLRRSTAGYIPVRDPTMG